jgi:hypothetical protein
MPELVPQSTLPPLAISPPPPSSLPAEWESVCVFRETFLAWLTPPGAAEALRFVGNLFFDLMLNADDWPTWTESPVRAELRGAAADLRFLQGFLTTIGTQEKKSDLRGDDAWLSHFAAKMAPMVGKIAEWIEKELQDAEAQS